MSKTTTRKKQLALLIPAHNEQMLLGQTIKSAIAAGLSARDIYVVDDASSDKTAKVAAKLLPKSHILTVEHSGKGGAITKAFKHFDFARRYKWVHISDADGVFGQDYFVIFKAGLSDDYVAATGFVQSLPGGWISKFRVYEYSYGQFVMRRFQKLIGSISVIPGPSSCFRTDIFGKLNFAADCATEDFDVTLQIHRKKLGKIGYIPAAKAYTQDPQTLRDYRNQMTRWQRGFFQGVLNNRVGLRAQPIDAYLGLLMLDMLIYYIQFLVVYPIFLIIHHDQFIRAASVLFVWDVATFFALTVIMAFASRRLDIIGAFPLFYILRLVQMWIFVRAFVQVVITRKHRHHSTIGWETSKRRYRSQGVKS